MQHYCDSICLQKCVMAHLPDSRHYHPAPALRPYPLGYVQFLCFTVGHRECRHV